MALKLQTLTRSNFNQVYKLLKELEFPYLPNNFAEVAEQLDKTNHHLIGGFINNKLVLFMCFAEYNQKLYFDIACKKNYQKKWATKATIKYIFNYAFNKLAYNKMYTESFSKNAKQAVLKIGFTKTKNVNEFVICEESNQVQKYLNNHKKERLIND